MLKTIFFDFNGVILDDEEYHYEALKKVFEEEGVSITRDVYFRDCLGYNDKELMIWGLGDTTSLLTNGAMEILLQRKAAYYEALVTKEARFFPGVCEFIRLAASEYPIGVASMALRQEIDWALKKAALLSLFSVIVSGEDVKKTKPDPEVYGTALKLMNRHLSGKSASEIMPADCLVIEDSVQGVQSGKAAGMQVLGLAHTMPPEQLNEADRVLPSLEGVTPVEVVAMFR